MSILKVPADYPTIQAAINAWTAGDEIWVAQGTYKENLTLIPDVRLKGGYNASYTAQNWIQWPSILDGDQKGSVVIGAANALLDGFTIRNGKAMRGAGVYLKAAAMQIRNNTIENNTAVYGGGGICVEDLGGSTFTDIDKNIIRLNTGEHGGGILVLNSKPGVRITNNIIGGKVGDGNKGRFGGGIAIEATPIFVIEGNTITQNSVQNGHGGGVGISEGSPNSQLIHNTIKNNTVDGNFGGGVHLVGSTFVSRNNIDGNNVIGGFPRHGGGLYVRSGGTPPRIENNFFRKNEAEKGGGVYLASGEMVMLVNNSVAYNLPDAANAGGGVYVAADATGVLMNNILWGNGNDLHQEKAGACLLLSNDIQNGGTPGQKGNISANPQFKSADDLHITKGSPAIDAGDSGGAPAIDIDGDKRSGKVDIGADELVSEQPTRPCWVRSAAKDSKLESGLNPLRQVRDRFLAINAAGRLIVRAHYAASVPLVQIFSAYPITRTVGRWAATPAAWVARWIMVFDSPEPVR